MLLRTLAVLALILNAESALAQGAIGAVRIQLGASKAATLASLRSLYRVQQQSGGASDTWSVQNLDGPPFRLLGQVSFEGDSVVTIARAWTSSNDRDPDEVARVVVGALRALADGTGPCLVQEILDRTYPEFMSQGVRVRCGAHAIEMTASSSGGRDSNSIDVNEVWRLGPPLH
jgi:hypothetical protein